MYNCCSHKCFSNLKEYFFSVYSTYKFLIDFAYTSMHEKRNNLAREKYLVGNTSITIYYETFVLEG